MGDVCSCWIITWSLGVSRGFAPNHEILLLPFDRWLHFRLDRRSHRCYLNFGNIVWGMYKPWDCSTAGEHGVVRSVSISGFRKYHNSGRLKRLCKCDIYLNILNEIRNWRWITNKCWIITIMASGYHHLADHRDRDIIDHFWHQRWNQTLIWNCTGHRRIHYDNRVVLR